MMAGAATEWRRPPGLSDAGAAFFAWQQGPGAFGSAAREEFRDLNSLHHAMIGVPDLIAPSPKSAARIDPLPGEPRMDGGQGPVAPRGGNRIRIGHPQQLAADDLGFRLLGREELAAHHASDGAVDHVV